MNIDWDLTGKLVTALVALYAAALSTVNAVLLNRRERRALRIETSVVPFPGEAINEPSKVALQIRTVNTGRRPITLANVGVRIGAQCLDLTEIAATLTNKWPRVIADGEVFRFQLASRRLAERLRAHGCSNRVRLRAWVSDSTGRRWKGERILIEVEDVTIAVVG